MRVCVLGLGHVGLPTAALFAEAGAEVLGVDVDADVVARINGGASHIAEPGLDEALRRVVRSGRLRAALRPAPADAFILAVPTPIAADRTPDLGFIHAATDAIAPVLAKGNLVVIESTVPVGTTEQVARRLSAARPDLCIPRDIALAHAPERVLPGRILTEAVENERILGGLTPRCAEAAAVLYRRFARGMIHLTDARTAEFAKLAENAHRDVNIAFANELELLAEGVGVDVRAAIRLANRHPRVSILRPGPGVGGHCVAVDPWFLAAAAPERARLIRTAREVNDAKPHHVVAKVRAAAARFRAPVIACLGLAYKADIDDLRESPAVIVVEELARLGVGELLVVEPHIGALPERLACRGLTLCGLAEALARAEILLLLVDHAPFLTLDRATLRDVVVIDTRGVW